MQNWVNRYLSGLVFASGLFFVARAEEPPKPAALPSNCRPDEHGNAVCVPSAEMNKEAPKPPDPQITAEMTRDYYRALSDLQTAQQASKDAQSRWEKAAATMQATCGTRGILPDADKGYRCGEPPPKPASAK